MAVITTTKYKCDLCQKESYNNQDWKQIVHAPVELYEVETQTKEDFCDKCWGELLMHIIKMKMRHMAKKA